MKSNLLRYILTVVAALIFVFLLFNFPLIQLSRSDHQHEPRMDNSLPGQIRLARLKLSDVKGSPLVGAAEASNSKADNDPDLPIGIPEDRPMYNNEMDDEEILLRHQQHQQEQEGEEQKQEEGEEEDLERNLTPDSMSDEKSKFIQILGGLVEEEEMIIEEYPDVHTIPQWLSGSGVTIKNLDSYMTKSRPYRVFFRNGVKYIKNIVGDYPMAGGPYQTLVGYGETEATACSGPVCNMNRGRKEIIVNPDTASNECLGRINDCVTMTVKTRGRYDLVENCVESIRKRYPEMKIVVADEIGVEMADNKAIKKSYEKLVKDENIVFVRALPGVGLGRKVALQLAETKYAMIMDDDFVVQNKTQVEFLVDVLERSSADIVGGAVADAMVYDGIFRFSDEKFCVNKCGQHQFNFAGAFYEKVPTYRFCFVGDRIKNFFLCRRQAVLDAGSWDPERPFYEHEDFFMRMRLGNLTTVYCENIQITHDTSNRNLAHLRRGSRWSMVEDFAEKWSLEQVVECSRFDYSSSMNRTCKLGNALNSMPAVDLKALKHLDRNQKKRDRN